jgi:hypothetical protein
MNQDPIEEGIDVGGETQASVEFNKKKSKPRERRGEKKVMKKAKRVKKVKKAKASGGRRGHAYEIVTGRAAAAYPTPREGSVPAAIWPALKAKKRATAKELAVAIVGKIAPASAKDRAYLVLHVGWYLTKWKKLKLVRFAKT